MKKAIIAGVLSALVSGSAFAANGWDTTKNWDPVTGATENVKGSTFVDTASAELVFKGALPMVSPGSYITLTGLGGGMITNGELEIDAAGSFASLKGIPTEVRKYNADDKEVGPILVDADVTELNWYVKQNPVVSAVASDFSTAVAVLRMNGDDVTAGSAPVATGMPTTDSLAEVNWEVRSEAPLASVVPGDEVTVTAQVDVQVTF
ncbi:hypothetical protein ACVTNF_001476 [Photobacterium damselae]